MGSASFSFTGSPQAWTIPRHRPGTLTVTMTGGLGGRGGPGFSTDFRGGAGGWVRGVLTATAGQAVTIDLGGAGGDGTQGLFPIDDPGHVPAAPGGGPRPGGVGGVYGSHSTGDTISYAASGGGASELWVAGVLVAVAGGGGGGGVKTGFTGVAVAGPGGTNTGLDGSNSPPSAASGNNGQGGFGGTATAGGAGGDPTPNRVAFVTVAGDGTATHGGNGGERIHVPGSPNSGSNCGGGGGGGGGWFGGGGGGAANLLGSAGGGGGGSSWASAAITLGAGPGSTSTGSTIWFEWVDAGGFFAGMPMG